MALKYTKEDLNNTLKEIKEAYEKAEKMADYLGEMFFNPLDVYGMGGWYNPKPATYTQVLERVADGVFEGNSLKQVTDLISKFNDLSEDEKEETYFDLENMELTDDDGSDNGYDSRYGWSSSSSSC